MLQTQEGPVSPEHVLALHAGGLASCFASNRRRLIRPLRAAQSVGRALGDALELGQAPRLAAPQVRPATVQRHAQGGVLSRRPQLGHEGLPWPPSTSAPRRPTSRGASPASALLGGHLADGERAVAKLLADPLELLAAPLGRALTLTPGRHRLR
jgi:hypothetical protein